MVLIESIEKLRKYADGFVTVQTHDDLMGLIDQIEAEIAEKYMELPTDADGVPIKVGDEIETRDGEKVNAHFVTDFAVAYFNSAHILTWGFAEEMHHVKPRTIEDVLRDCCNEWNKHLSSDWEAGVYAEYADEIRELLGVG